MLKKLLNRHFWLNILFRVRADILKKKIRGCIVLLLVAGAWFLWGWIAGILWVLFLAFLAYDWDNRIIGVLALACLAACPLLLLFHKDNAAEQIAVFAYYFLAMTVILQIVEYKRHPGRIDEE